MQESINIKLRKGIDSDFKRKDHTGPDSYLWGKIYFVKMQEHNWSVRFLRKGVVTTREFTEVFNAGLVYVPDGNNQSLLH